MILIKFCIIGSQYQVKWLELMWLPMNTSNLCLAYLLGQYKGNVDTWLPAVQSASVASTENELTFGYLPTTVAITSCPVSCDACPLSFFPAGLGLWVLAGSGSDDWANVKRYWSFCCRSRRARKTAPLMLRLNCVCASGPKCTPSLVKLLFWSLQSPKCGQYIKDLDAARISRNCRFTTCNSSA